MKRLGAWTQQWAVPELAGGLSGRDAIGLHARLCHDIERADDLVLCSQDLTKAFDTVHVGQALALISKMGAPESLCKLARSFYI